MCLKISRTPLLALVMGIYLELSIRNGKTLNKFHGMKFRKTVLAVQYLVGLLKVGNRQIIHNIVNVKQTSHLNEIRFVLFVFS